MLEIHVHLHHHYHKYPPRFHYVHKRRILLKPGH
jgi:hypothetical protein